MIKPLCGFWLGSKATRQLLARDKARVKETEETDKKWILSEILEEQQALKAEILHQEAEEKRRLKEIQSSHEGTYSDAYQELLRRTRRKTGVYLFYVIKDNIMTVLYIGRSHNLGSRIPSSLKGILPMLLMEAEPEGIIGIQVLLYQTKADSMVAELVWIATLKPKLNGADKPNDDLTGIWRPKRSPETMWAAIFEDESPRAHLRVEQEPSL